MLLSAFPVLDGANHSLVHGYEWKDPGWLPRTEVVLLKVCRINLWHTCGVRESLLLKMKTGGLQLFQFRLPFTVRPWALYLMNRWMALPSWETGNDGPDCWAWTGVNRRATHTSFNPMNAFFSYCIQGAGKHFFLISQPHHTAYGILVPWPRIELKPPALAVLS